MMKIGPPLSEQELCPVELLDAQEAALQRDIERLHARVAEFVLVPCPACAATTSRPRFQKFGFQFVMCRRCDTIYMNPRPSPPVMADYYAKSENYAYWAKHIFPLSEASRREKIHRLWLDRIFDFCERHGIPSRTLIEVGPGFGTFAALSIESGRFDRVVAIEPTPELAEACRSRGVPIVEKRIEDVTDEDVPAADILCAFEVIEHLFDPSMFLAQCARLVRSGGMIVVSCPNGLGFDISVLGANSLAVDNEHVNLFNPKSLSELVSNHGFEVLEITTPGRLDAELVREAVLRGDFDLANQTFLRRVLIEEWERLAWPFQKFLATNGLSSHMWLAARRN
jgi:2-polyprenyl-3-methyl-5-hydroxy-6-metoxy-1,4-benzoquinol methylase